MTAFGYTRLTSMADAPLRSTSQLLAGGTDLLPLVKSGLVAPEQVFDIKGTELSAGVEPTEDGWSIGALTTLSTLEMDPLLATRRTVLKQAVAPPATAQIRNRATVGGNLLQRPRCSYYRNEAVNCWFKGGQDCPARQGHNEHHAIVDTGPCIAVQPSDLASALVAVGATVHLRTPDGDASMPVAEFLVPPTEDRRSLNKLGEDQIITAVSVPDDGDVVSTYLKVMDRKAWAFALTGLAAVIGTQDGTVNRISLVATGVAATPWRLTQAEEVLRGSRLDSSTIDQACRAATSGMDALSQNAYKLRLVSGLTRRALQTL